MAEKVLYMNKACIGFQEGNQWAWLISYRELLASMVNNNNMSWPFHVKGFSHQEKRRQIMCPSHQSACKMIIGAIHGIIAWEIVFIHGNKWKTAVKCPIYRGIKVHFRRFNPLWPSDVIWWRQHVVWTPNIFHYEKIPPNFICFFFKRKHHHLLESIAKIAQLYISTLLWGGGGHFEEKK